MDSSGTFPITGTAVVSGGSPVGMLAGQPGNLAFDTGSGLLYSCTTSGTASTAVWTLITAVSASVSGTPVGTLAGTLGEFVLDIATNVPYICTTSGAAGTAAWTPFISVSNWTNGSNANGSWRKTPDGYIEQWGMVTMAATSETVTFPIPFPTEIFGASVTANSSSASLGNQTSYYSPTLTNMGVTIDTSGPSVFWRAWGN
ncbi:MAG: gp53-like domain-containing protein [Sulfobacillus sp.]